MGFFYFDESIHERAGFILGAFVHTKDARLAQPPVHAPARTGFVAKAPRGWSTSAITQRLF